MNCERFQELLAKAWADSLEAGQREELERHLTECGACRNERETLDVLRENLGQIPLEAPSPVLHRRFNAMLEGYRQAVEKPDVRLTKSESAGRWPNLWLRPAFQFGLGLILILFGYLGGYWVRSDSGRHEEIADLQAEVHETRQMLAISLLNQSSASERLKGTSWSTQVSSPDAEFLETLNHTLNSDTNVNVRLAAMDALAHFAADPAVRQGLNKSLAAQDSPLVQIMLIDLLVQLHEHQSIDVLRRVADDANQNPQVRDQAQWGLQKLLL